MNKIVKSRFENFSQYRRFYVMGKLYNFFFRETYFCIQQCRLYIFMKWIIYEVVLGNRLCGCVSKGVCVFFFFFFLYFLQQKRHFSLYIPFRIDFIYFDCSIRNRLNFKWSYCLLASFLCKNSKQTQFVKFINFFIFRYLFCIIVLCIFVRRNIYIAQNLGESHIPVAVVLLYRQFHL